MLLKNEVSRYYSDVYQYCYQTRYRTLIFVKTYA